LGAKKIKIPKKEALKAQKALENAITPVLSREWIELHLSKILAGLVALCLALGSLWGFTAYGQSKERRAQVDYTTITQSWPGVENSDRQAWEKLVSELEKFLKDHSGTAPVNDAQLDLARAYFQTQQYENALNWNKKVLDQLPRDQGLKILAQYQQAFVYEALGKTDEAITLWNDLKGNDSSELKKEAEWNLARLYARKGDYSKAAEQYETSLKAPGNYPSSALLQDELASLKVKMNAPTAQKGSGQ
jgi:predicted negative regulator of RcsB-dependent stress response